MKKVFATLLAGLMTVSLLAGCGAQAAPETEAPAAATEAKAYADMTIDELKPLVKTLNEGKLTMVTSPDFAPYEFYALDENGKPSLAGFDVALGQYIADFLGLQLEVIPMDFDGTITELAGKKADIGMAGYSPDPAREKVMSFSDVYYTGGQSFVTVKDKAEQFPDLASANKADYQIGVQLGSIQAKLAEENTPDADIIPLSKVTDIIAELLSGKLDGAFIETVPAQAYAKNYPDLALVLDVPYEAEGSVVGVSKDNEALLAAVNLAINAALEDGSMAQFVADANELASGDKFEGLLNADGSVGE